MSILKKYQNALELLNRNDIENCLHDDYQFTNYSQDKVINKSEVVSWALTGDVKRDKIRILYENSDIGVEHSFVSFNDGNRQAVLAFYTFKDGKILTVETGATNLAK